LHTPEEGIDGGVRRTTSAKDGRVESSSSSELGYRNSLERPKEVVAGWKGGSAGERRRDKDEDPEA
jgi:hypothetical protein